MPCLPAAVPAPAVPRFSHSADQYLHYESIADPADCLHLPADQCDHRTFRCAHCCEHPA